jgi:uncharacterized membrane protein YhhN
MPHAPQAALAAVSLLAACVYGFGFLQKPPSALRTLAKTAAVAVLAAAAWLSGQGWLLAIGLTLSALGDAVLAGDHKRRLPLALVSFLLAHAAYIVLFIHAGGGVAMVRAEPIRFAGVMATTAGAVFVLRLILPSLGPLLGPVLVYMLAILGMVFAAVALPLARWSAILGAFAFAASDGVLAVRLFKYGGRPNRAADLAVWWLYYGAQAGVAWAFLK